MVKLTRVLGATYVTAGIHRVLEESNSRHDQSHIRTRWKLSNGSATFTAGNTADEPPAARMVGGQKLRHGQLDSRPSRQCQMHGRQCYRPIACRACVQNGQESRHGQSDPSQCRMHGRSTTCQNHGTITVICAATSRQCRTHGRPYRWQAAGWGVPGLRSAARSFGTIKLTPRCRFTAGNAGEHLPAAEFFENGPGPHVTAQSN